MQQAELEQQIKVSKMLGSGFVLSLLGIGGIASFAALILGLKAKRLIERSNAEITGIRLAWWCIMAGALGTTVLPLLTAIIIFK